MGAIVVSAFVTIVAIVGVIYFNYQDKKEEHKANNKIYLRGGEEPGLIIPNVHFAIRNLMWQLRILLGKQR